MCLSWKTETCMWLVSPMSLQATRSIHSLTFPDQHQLDLYPFSCPPCCPDTGLSSGSLFLSVSTFMSSMCLRVHEQTHWELISEKMRANLLDYFLWSNKSQINQSLGQKIRSFDLPVIVSGGARKGPAHLANLGTTCNYHQVHVFIQSSSIFTKAIMHTNASHIRPPGLCGAEGRVWQEAVPAAAKVDWCIHLNLLADSMHTYVSLRTPWLLTRTLYTRTHIHTYTLGWLHKYVSTTCRCDCLHARTHTRTHWHMCPCFDNSTISDAVLSIEIVFCACTAFEVHNSQVCTFAKTTSDVSRVQPSL